MVNVVLTTMGHSHILRGTIYITYKKPIQSVGADWRFKLGSVSGGVLGVSEIDVNIYDIEIPEACFNHSEEDLRFRINMGSAYNTVNHTPAFYCYNGSWNLLFNNDTFSGTSSVGGNTNPTVVVNDGDWHSGGFQWGTNWYQWGGGVVARLFDEAVIWNVDEYAHYRLENNSCSLIEVNHSETTPNDYETLSECEENILYDFFRLEDNSCEEISIILSEVTENDYETLNECEELIFYDYFRLENNSCVNVSLIIDNTTSNDYETLVECESNIVQPSSSGGSSSSSTPSVTEEIIEPEETNFTESSTGIIAITGNAINTGVDFVKDNYFVFGGVAILILAGVGFLIFRKK